MPGPDTDPEINAVLQLGVNQQAILEALERMPVEKILRVLSYMRSTGLTGETFAAIRDAGRLLVEKRLAEEHVQALDRVNDGLAKVTRGLRALDKSAASLTRKGWWIGLLIALGSSIFTIVLARYCVPAAEPAIAPARVLSPTVTATAALRLTPARPPNTPTARRIP